MVNHQLETIDRRDLSMNAPSAGAIFSAGVVGISDRRVRHLWECEACGYTEFGRSSFPA
jgi:hypothetical protein